MIEISDEDFEELVCDALDMIPEEFAQQMVNLAFLIEDRDPTNPGILGLYSGVALPERTFDHTGVLPDTITIYRESLKEYCQSYEELVQEIIVTVHHEVGHYFGLDEEDLHRLGWA